nr:glycosyltransferase [Lewinella sp. JB7]
MITPLDWGLGHASRSLALARRLTDGGDRISWACSGPAAAMLRRELPAATIHALPPYAVTYPTASMVWNVARQAWRWQRTIRAEHRAVAELVATLEVDRIVSDSRFGCYHHEVPSIFVTHQLHPITGFAPASALYRWQLRHFDEFWVPDHAGHDRLSGKLSDPAGYDSVRFIGPLSRLSATPGTEPFDVLVLLSGPEPMRTRLEEIILPQLSGLGRSYRVVRGLPQERTSPTPAQLDFADTPTLSRLLTAARCVVARPGYSSLMDLRALGKPAVLIPTPGQTEQAYLAQRAQLQGWAVAVMDQEQLDLAEALGRLPGH